MARKVGDEDFETPYVVTCQRQSRLRRGGLFLKAAELVFQLGHAAVEAFQNFSHFGGNGHAVVAMVARGGAAFDGIFKLFAASATGAETLAGRNFFHGGLALPFFQITHGAGYAAVHQQAAVTRAGFADGSDADGGFVGDGTFVFADAAADAQRGVNIRPAQRDGRAVAFGDGDFARKNGLGRHGTNLFADDVRRFHRPRQAAAVIEKRGAKLDRAFLNEQSGAGFFLDGHALDRAGRADLAAERAVHLAETDLHIEDRRPDACDAGFQQRRLQHVRRAGADALVALDAAVEEINFLHGAGRADDFFVVVAVARAGRAAKGVKAQPDQRAEKRAASGHGGRGDFAFERWQKFERDRVFWAVFDAIEADETFALAKLRVRVGRAFATFQAEVAVHALGWVAVNPPQRRHGQRAEKRAERTQHAAKEARDDDVHADEEQQQKTDDPRADVEVLADVNARRHKQIDERQNDRAH